MTFTFRPASHFKEAAGLFISLTGGTNSGKTFSALTLARGIAGNGKIAVLDTEGGRTLNLKDKFDFDAMVMDPPFRPDAFAQAAQDAEAAGYGALLIDSFSHEWAGLGGVLDWQEQEFQRMGARDAIKMASWIKPKSAHKAMVMSLLQRRIPIIFSIRGEESVTMDGGKPVKILKSICSKSFQFEVTIAFRLAADRKGYIDLSDPKTWKMEEGHTAIFKDGERISEGHGAALKRWSIGEAVSAEGKPPEDKPSTERDPQATALTAEGFDAAERGSGVLKTFWGRLTPAEKKAVGGASTLERFKTAAASADAEIAKEETVSG